MLGGDKFLDAQSGWDEFMDLVGVKNPPTLKRGGEDAEHEPLEIPSILGPLKKPVEAVKEAAQETVGGWVEQYLPTIVVILIALLFFIIAFMSSEKNRKTIINLATKGK